MGLVIKHIPASALFVTQPPPHMFGNPGNSPRWAKGTNWLKSRFHFSFAEYFNPDNQQFGVLRVLNDDIVQGERGFGTHPHRDMEIVTYIVEGELTHKDSTGTDESLGRGSCQFMSAGRGIRHSERNLKDKPLRFLQIWMTPRERNLPPNYGGFDGSTDAARKARRNQFAWLVGDANSPTGSKAPVTIQQDANIGVSELDPDQQLTFKLEAGRQAYLVCIEGAVELADASSGGDSESGECSQLEMHDAAELRGAGELRLKASTQGTHVLLIEMAAGPGGRKDL